MEKMTERKPFIININIGCGLFLVAGIIVGSYIAFVIKSPNHNISHENLVNIFNMIIDYSPLLSITIGGILGLISKTSNKNFDVNYGKTLGLGLISCLLGYLLFLFSVLAIINYVSPGAFNYMIDTRNF